MELAYVWGIFCTIIGHYISKNVFTRPEPVSVVILYYAVLHFAVYVISSFIAIIITT